MEKKEKIFACLGFIVFTPIVFWILAAKFYYGWSDQTFKNRITVMLAHTFELQPLYLALIFGLVIGIIISIIFYTHVEEKAFRGAKFKKLYRGTKLVSARELANLTRNRKEKQITIADIPIPKNVETTHFAIAGSTGTGKSTIFKEMMFKLLQRGDRMVVLDPDGEFLKAFGKSSKDKILNPYDKRTEKWSFFNEIRNTDYDFERFSNSIVQKSNSSDSEEWNKYGRLLLSETAKKLYLTQANPTTTELFNYTNIVQTEELKQFLEGTPAQSLFAEGAERATGSARFVLSTSLPPHIDMPLGSFSIRDWIERDEGNLFITWKEPQRAALKPLISCWVDIIITSTLGLEADLKRRLFIFIDELESLSNLPTLADGLTKGRKKGLCLVNGFQTYTQLQAVYGDKQAETMLANHRTLVTLAVGRGGDATASFVSKALGEHEIERKKKGAGFSSRSAFMNEQTEFKTEYVVLKSEIMALDNLEGYLSLPGHFPIAKFKTKIVDYERREKIPGFLENKDTNFLMDADPSNLNQT